jgi:NCAIR mutase (PurE)-related protein
VKRDDQRPRLFAGEGGVAQDRRQTGAAVDRANETELAGIRRHLLQAQNRIGGQPQGMVVQAGQHGVLAGAVVKAADAFQDQRRR